MVIYLATTPDHLELPIAVADTPRELAGILGITKNAVNLGVYEYKRHSHRGQSRGYKIIKVEVADDEL